MSFLTKGFSAVLGGGGEGAPADANGADAVERLCSRLQSSTLIEDRRDAARGLKGLAKQFKLEVGTQGMDFLISSVEKDRSDPEVVANSLEALLSVISASPSPEGKKDDEIPPDSDLGVQFTEIFVKRQENVAMLLGLLEEYDFPVRWPTVKLLTTLLTNKTTRVQECVLESPGSVPLLMDLLSDNREIIRNDGLLLLSKLSSRNTQIQRMVAFSGGMERLLEIISEESHSDGGIVVEDCILLLLSLIRSNSSNQSYFREASLVPRMAPFFEFSGEWTTQKVRNVILMLRLIRAFVSPIQSQTQSTAAAQLAFSQCGIFATLCQLAYTVNLEQTVVVEVMSTVAELMRGNASNQNHFLTVQNATIGSHSPLVATIMSLVAEGRSLDLSLGNLYCLQCLLLHNEAVQQHVVTTLMPTEGQAPGTITAGHLLCRGLFSRSEVIMWCSAAALVACMETTANKEELLRVQLSVADGSTVALIHQAGLMASSKDYPCRARSGLLLLLSHWLHDCPAAVSKLLASQPCVQFLISAVEEQPDSEEQTIIRGLAALVIGLCLLVKGVKTTGEFTQESLLEIAQRRIRPENFSESLSTISQSELYIRASRSFSPPAEVIFDYQYVQLFKQTSDNVLRVVQGQLDIASSPPSPSSGRRSPEAPQTSTHIMEHDAVVTSYKELIRDQDSQLISLREEMDNIKKQRAREQDERAALSRQVEELQRGQADVADGGRRQDQINGGADTAEVLAANASMSQQLQELTTMVSTLKQEKIALQTQLETRPSSTTAQPSTSPSQVDQQQAIALQTANQELEQLRQSLRQAEQRLLEERETLGRREEEVVSLSGRLQLSEQQREKSDAELKAYVAESRDESGEDLKELVAKLKASNEDLMRRHGKLNEGQQTLQSEVDDLLVLLANQDLKLKKWRDRLVGNGLEASEDEDEDDDEESDEAAEDSESAPDEDEG